MLEQSFYHKLLRVGMLVAAIALVFDSGFLNERTAFLSTNTQQYVANAVSVGVGVKATEINTLTAKIAQREKELDEREALLADRAIDIGLVESGTAPRADYSTYILSTILFILTVLVVLNYALDYLRERRRFYELTHEKAS